jgi:hypothetical protein
MGVQVTRINDWVERFPEAECWQHDDRSNSLLVTKGEHVIAISHPANGVTWPTIEKYTLLARSAPKPFSPGRRRSSNKGDVGRADCGTQDDP